MKGLGMEYLTATSSIEATTANIRCGSRADKMILTVICRETSDDGYPEQGNRSRNNTHVGSFRFFLSLSGEEVSVRLELEVEIGDVY